MNSSRLTIVENTDRIVAKVGFTGATQSDATAAGERSASGAMSTAKRIVSVKRWGDGAAEIDQVTVRAFPWPYRGMLAICSDIDRTTPERLCSSHRFLNTREMTALGQGLGLDISDSFWFYAPPPAGEWATTQMAFFSGMDWQKRSAFADQILDYIRGGWVDTLHSYGNFSGNPVGTPAASPASMRRGRLMCLPRPVSRSSSGPITGTRTTSRISARAPLGGRPAGGPLPSQRSEWRSQVCTSSGPRLMSADFRRDEAVQPGEVARRAKGLAIFAAGPCVFRRPEGADELARRFGAIVRPGGGGAIAVVWHPQLLHIQLSAGNLAELAEKGGYAIVGQHLGRGHKEVLSTKAVEALCRLKSAQDAGNILVARTSRLLEYAVTRDGLRFEATRDASGKTTIDIAGIDDPVRGAQQAPDLDRLRGITFEVPGNGPVELRLRGSLVAQPGNRRGLASAKIAQSGSGGFHWITRITPMSGSAGWRTGSAEPMPEPIEGEQAATLTTRVLDWLDREREARPPGIDERAWDYAVRYTRGRYQIGLERYRRLFHELGWSGKRHGLDIGSGAGHWAVAFALDNEQVTGIDRSKGFVHLANGAAAELGLAGRVRHQLGRAEELDFPDASFDAAWSHSVLMFCDTEDSISEIARVLEPGGQFYCGYSSTGFRLRRIYAAVSNSSDLPWRRSSATI